MKQRTRPGQKPNRKRPLLLGLAVEVIELNPQRGPTNLGDGSEAFGKERGKLVKLLLLAGRNLNRIHAAGGVPIDESGQPNAGGLVATIVNEDRDEGMLRRIEKLNNRSRNLRHAQPSRDRKPGGMRTHRLATRTVFDLGGLRLPQNVRRWSLGLRLDRRGGFGSEQRIEVR